MGLLDSILAAQDGQIVGKIAQNFGLDQRTAEAAIRHLTPAISRGMQRNMGDQNGIDAILDALNQGNHRRYVDDPDRLQRASTIDEGNSILAHIFGSKNVSRNVAEHAARQTGLDSALLKKMLPILATVAMGMMRKQSTAAGGLRNAIGSSRSRRDLGGLLSSFLDADNDGSIADDLFKMATKLI